MLFITFLFMLVIGYFYYLHGVSSGFVDEYDNIVSAHFMVKGKVLYKDIFHNRQLGMPYISYVIQRVAHPATLYQLILYHRVFVILFSLCMSLIIVWRFSIAGMLAVFLYEIIKFYSFGNLFQGEALVVYPILYLFGLSIESSSFKQLARPDVIFAGIFTLFIFFTRETYIPLAAFLFLFIAYHQKSLRGKIMSISSVALFSILILSMIPLKDFLLQVFYVNSHVKIFHNEFNLLASFFYPLYIFFPIGEWTYTRIIEIITSSIFLILSTRYIFASKKTKEGFLIFVSLGLACIRIVPPGTQLYSAYKMLIWYALFFYVLFILVIRLFEKTDEKYAKIFTALLITSIFGYSIFTSSLFSTKIDRNREFNIEYARYFINGEVINSLAESHDTLFVDGYDSLLFWQAHTNPSYRYVLYYPILQGIQPFEKERLEMFRSHPPTFYFRDCISKNNLQLPSFVKNEYLNFKSDQGFSCLYMQKKKLPLSEDQTTSIARLGYRLD